jgi:Cu(I)/Ag(I) efflux system periplasmic protein CusF
MKDLNTMNTHLNTLIIAISIALLAPLGAAANDAHHKPAAAASAGAADLTDGEVRKVDLDAGKVTLKHGEIKSLDMPAMTMVFVVKNRSALERLKAGDKVKFKAINDAGRFTVTEIESAK